MARPISLHGVSFLVRAWAPFPVVAIKQSACYRLEHNRSTAELIKPEIEDGWDAS